MHFLAAILRRRPRRLPHKYRRRSVGHPIRLIRKRQRVPEHALVVVRHQPGRDQHQNRRSNQTPRFSNGRQEQCRRGRPAHQQSFIRTAIRKKDRPHRHQHSVSNIRAIFHAFHAGKSAQHQRASRRRDRAAIISVHPVAEQPQPDDRQHATQAAPSRAAAILASSSTARRTSAPRSTTPRTRDARTTLVPPPSSDPAPESTSTCKSAAGRCENFRSASTSDESDWSAFPMRRCPLPEGS